MNAYFIRRWVAPVIIAWSATSTIAVAQTSAKTWFVEPPTRIEVAATAAVLQSRFDELRSGFFTSVTTQAKGNAVTVSFKGWAPTAGQADFLARTPGRLTISRRGSRPFIVAADVVDAQELPNNTVAIRLTDEGGIRMTRATRDLVGTSISVDLDGKPIAQPRVDEPLSGRFALGMSTGPDAKLVSIILRTGPLPNGVMVFNSSGLPTTPPR